MMPQPDMEDAGQTCTICGPKVCGEGFPCGPKVCGEKGPSGTHLPKHNPMGSHFAQLGTELERGVPGEAPLLVGKPAPCLWKVAGCAMRTAKGPRSGTPWRIATHR